MPSIPDTFIDDLIARVDLADLIGRYVTLKKVGSRAMAVCPFHGDTKPSLSVSPDRGLWYCFGCQEGGTAISFIQKKENLEFVDAVKFLARLYGIPVPEVASDPRAARRRTLYDINEHARDLYVKVLKSKHGRPFREYLAKRGYKRATIEAYLVGASIISWEFITEKLRDQGFKTEDLIEAGVVVPGKTKGVYDRFRGRLMIPIIDTLDRTLGFGARAMGDDEPKYINSPESPIFHKSKVLFGLNPAKDACRETSQLIVMEGYTDVMHAHQAGFKNSCAVMGTALTGDHIPLLRRFAEEVILAFDGDEAGRRAALKSLLPMAGSDLTVKVLALPPGTDPADIITREGADRFRELLEGASPAADWVFKTYADPVREKGLEAKIRGFEEVARYISAHGSKAIRDELLEKACIAFNCPMPPLADILEQVVQQRRGQAGKTDTGTMEAFLQGGERVEKTLFLSLMGNPRYLPDVRESLDPEDFYHPLHRRLARILFEPGFALGTPDGLTRLSEVYEDQDLHSLVVGLVMELDDDRDEEGDGDAPRFSEDEMRFSLLSMIRRKYDNESKKLQALIAERSAEAGDKTDDEKLLELMTHRRELDEQFRMIQDALAGQGGG